MAKANEASSKLGPIVEEFIRGSVEPVTFTQVIAYVGDKSTPNSFRPIDVKLATYRVIDDGKAKFTERWRIAKSIE